MKAMGRHATRAGKNSIAASIRKPDLLQQGDMPDWALWIEAGRVYGQAGATTAIY
jgi:hypothetical protein